MNHGTNIAETGWAVFEGGIVAPVNDLRDHELANQDCWCRPRLEEGIIIHNSMDRREEYEEGRQTS